VEVMETCFSVIATVVYLSLLLVSNAVAIVHEVSHDFFLKHTSPCHYSGILQSLFKKSVSNSAFLYPKYRGLVQTNDSSKMVVLQC
jgi:hypothetical protein